MPKVLVADDSIAVRKVAERLLTEAGFGVTLAANGEEALAYLAKETPDLVVSDVIMPDKSGYEVCAFVRAQKALVNTPVLLISGIVNDEVTKQAESCHADGVLKKPFQGTSLKDRVLELLAKRQGAAAPAAELLVERNRATHSTQQVAQLEGLLGSVKELESMLAMEREQTTQLKKQLAEADSATARVQELESTLQADRQAATQLVQTMTAMEESVTRSQGLAQQLAKEQERTSDLTRRVAESEQAAGRVRTLEQALAAEQEKSKGLAARVSEAERASQKAQEFETLLRTERERNSQMAKHVSETEQAAEQATKRFEEIATKLGEIAGLASQLGSGKQRH
ncbi:MAG TPA: response regulator [Nitrospiraceae bacterium]|nr:response regulator [Nitrospiraceae bacterium]